MPTAIVWDKEDSRVFRALRDTLPETTLFSASPARPPGGNVSCDLWIIAPEAPRFASPPPAVSRTVLVPGSAAQPVDAPCLLTYGLKARETITLSSFDDGRMAVAVQRDFADLFGQPVVRQEIVLAQPKGLTREEALCVLGGRLLLGLPPSLAH